MWQLRPVDGSAIVTRLALSLGLSGIGVALLARGWWGVALPFLFFGGRFSAHLAYMVKWRLLNISWPEAAALLNLMADKLPLGVLAVNPETGDLFQRFDDPGTGRPYLLRLIGEDFLGATKLGVEHGAGVSRCRAESLTFVGGRGGIYLRRSVATLSIHEGEASIIDVEDAKPERRRGRSGRQPERVSVNELIETAVLLLPVVLVSAPEDA